ncbi:MAG: glycogen synthase [Flavobacteria bacterium RIFCSPLOWO2_12_FULL_35_11]|nr:MAG: glycogen synthase [Flavobacteria bacterium RIFCSPLOWO2_12_FULL_35_11]
MKITHVSAECYPVAKVGGLADVVGALPKYQNDAGFTAEVIMPFYDNKFTKNEEFTVIFTSKLNLGKQEYSYQIKTLNNNNLGFNLYLVDVPELLFTDFVYSFDDTERFLAFQIAALNWMLTWDEKPTTVHCHDHHTGLIPFMMTRSIDYEALKNIPTVLTIHNAQYQGWFSHDKVGLIPEFNFSNVGLLDWDGSINPLASAIKCAWKVTTVSPSYMEELKKAANGLETLLSHESAKCTGILNGIDWEVWNPETDAYLVENYNINNVESGREVNKKWLCSHYNLDFEKPLFAFIGRLVGEKGADLFPETFKKALQKGNISIFLLGSGNDAVEADLIELKKDYVGSYNAFVGYNEKLAHIVYAGADFILMPSRVEPCGLNQMYALRYGSIPIVRSIGGLKDTVVDISEKGGFGICHKEVTVSEITEAIERGAKLFENQEKYKKIRKKIMGIDHSWDASALAYINLYKSLNQ